MLCDALDYKKIAQLLQKNPLNKKYSGRPLWGNVPQCKLPRREWFDVFENQKNIVSLGAALGRARDADKPLSIIKFFKTDPKALLLRARTVPFEIVFGW